MHPWRIRQHTGKSIICLWTTGGLIVTCFLYHCEHTCHLKLVLGVYSSVFINCPNQNFCGSNERFKCKLHSKCDSFRQPHRSLNRWLTILSIQQLHSPWRIQFSRDPHRICAYNHSNICRVKWTAAVFWLHSSLLQGRHSVVCNSQHIRVD